MKRRHFVALMAGAPIIAAWPELAGAARPEIASLPTRKITSVEIVYQTPHGHANGMHVAAEGFWVIDQSPGNFASLINPDTGKLIRDIQVQNISGASGICIDDDNVMWIGSTGNRFIVAANPKDGSTIAKYLTPGASAAYQMKGDAQYRGTGELPAPIRIAEDKQWAARNRPPGQAAPANRAGPSTAATAQERAAANSARSASSHLPAGQAPIEQLQAGAGSGAHCVLAKGQMLYIAVPPARSIYVVDKRNWEIQDIWPTAGSRPHDMTWADESKTKVWASDSNLHAFFLHDVQTGKISERIQLPDNSALVHGAKLYKSYMYCCDDVGWMFRFKM